jgi:hypothetical protein
MGVKLAAASGGSIELVPTNTASNFTLTVPAATTTVVGTDATQTLTNKTLTTPNIDSAQFETVSGTAPLYAARAWVNFNGIGTVAIRASGNVSSITDNGTGDYTVNFTTALTDANYNTSFGGQQDDTSQPILIGLRLTSDSGTGASVTTSAIRLLSAQSGTATDIFWANVAIFR